MRPILSLMVLILLGGCTDSAEKSDLKHLEGYWEIAEVIFPNGEKKEYSKVNPAIDFIHLDGMEGYRKKVHPKLDGTFDTSDDAEAFTVIESKGKLFLKYSNDLSKWEEYIKKLSSDEMVLVNEETISYTYKRYEPIDITK